MNASRDLAIGTTWPWLAALVLAAALATGCSESSTDGVSERDGRTPSASPAQPPDSATAPSRPPRPEDSAMPGPLPKAGDPSTAKDNPTGTGPGK